MDRDEVLRLLRALESAGVDYVLIGAAAMGMHGIVRATEDLDFLVRAARDNIEKLQVALRDAYEDDPNVDDIQADDLVGEYPAVRYFPPRGDLYLDLITRLGVMATYESVEAETKDFEGIPVRVATPAALYRLKKGTVRPSDWRDAALLKHHFDLEEDD